MTNTSLSSMYRIVKTIDPGIRIGKDAGENLRYVVEEYASMISELAIAIARNANRRTILSQDIIMAKEQLLVGMMFHGSKPRKQGRDHNGPRERR